MRSTTPLRSAPPTAATPLDIARRETGADSPWFRWVACLAVASTYLLVVMGAVVRASGSGLGCPDWPLCYGQVVPPGHTPSIIEYTHRLLGGVTSALIVGTLVLWARSAGFNGRVVSAGIGLAALLLAQIILGAVTVLMELPPMVVMVHLGLAILLLGALVLIAVHASTGGRTLVPMGTRQLRRLTISAAAAVYLLILVGAYVRATGATWACVGFPTCNGELLPFGRAPLMDLQLVHRLLAYAVGAHVIVTIARAWRARPANRTLRTAAAIVGVCLVAQITIGATIVSTGVPPIGQVLHVAGAAGLWASVVALAALSARAGGAEGTQGWT